MLRISKRRVEIVFDERFAPAVDGVLAGIEGR